MVSFARFLTFYIWWVKSNSNHFLCFQRHRIRSPVGAVECGQSRQSIVCFVHPNYETELEELNFNLSRPTTSCIQPPLFDHKDGKCITAVEWAEMRYHNAYAHNRWMIVKSLLCSAHTQFAKMVHNLDSVLITWKLYTIVWILHITIYYATIIITWKAIKFHLARCWYRNMLLRSCELSITILGDSPF